MKCCELPCDAKSKINIIVLFWTLIIYVMIPNRLYSSRSSVSVFMNFLYLLWFNILGGDSDSLNEDTQMTGH